MYHTRPYWDFTIPYIQDGRKTLHLNVTVS